MLNSILLSTVVVVDDYPIEDIVTEAESTGFDTVAITKFVILFAILIIVGAIIIFRPTNKNKKDAKQFLEKLITTIYSIVMANIEYITTDGAEDANKLDFNEFKKQLVEMMYNDAWSFVETSVDTAVSEGKLDYIAKGLIKKSNVDNLVDLIVKRRDTNNMIQEAFNQISNAAFKSIIDNEKKAVEEAAAAEEGKIPEGYGEPDMDLINKVDKEQEDNGIVEAFANPEDTAPTDDIDEVIEDDRPVNDESGEILIMEDGQG